MRQFKFFHQVGKPLFQTEITYDIQRTPHSNMYWSMEYSETIKDWMSEIYFSNDYLNPNYHFKYLPQIDRTCEIMYHPEITNSLNYQSQLFKVNIKIWKSTSEWMIVTLAYPIEHIIYR